MTYDPTADLDRMVAQQVGWTWFDDHLLYACQVYHDLVEHQLANVKSQPTRIRTDRDELCLAESRATLLLWRAVGDGTWEQREVNATGSMSFVVAAHLGNAMLNRSRRNRAQRALAPRWVAEPPGAVMVSDRRAHFYNADGSFTFYWSGLDTVELIAPDRLVCGFSDDGGDKHLVQLYSPWAVLMFVLAAHAYFPHHPTLLSGVWLPPGFEDKCHLAGKTCPKVRERQ